MPQNLLWFSFAPDPTGRIYSISTQPLAAFGEGNCSVVGVKVEGRKSPTPI